MKTYCSKPTSSAQGKFASNFWRKVTYKAGKGKKGQKYVQRKSNLVTASCSSLRNSIVSLDSDWLH
jgi:hypothetical protein